jgi:4-hydroxy-tetrahydrodipicolinate reductase
MTRLVITGVGGRMGQTLVRVAHGSDGVSVVAGTERPGASSVGQDAGVAAGIGAIGAKVFADLAEAIDAVKPQAVIDFTSAQASLAHARVCAQRQVAWVCGTTGFSAEERAQLSELAQGARMVVAPNMSVGVNVMIKVAGQLARVLGPGFEVDVLEAHHRKKKDAPSGTALRLAEEIAQATGRGAAQFRASREGLIGERPPDEIGLQTLRGGDVVGEHTVYFFGDGERVELTHRATSRDQFALGAVRAARWLEGRPPGLYDMQDVLGLREGA